MKSVTFQNAIFQTFSWWDNSSMHLHDILKNHSSKLNLFNDSKFANLHDWFFTKTHWSIPNVQNIKMIQFSQQNPKSANKYQFEKQPNTNILWWKGNQQNLWIIWSVFYFILFYKLTMCLCNIAWTPIKY